MKIVIHVIDVSNSCHSHKQCIFSHKVLYILIYLPRLPHLYMTGKGEHIVHIFVQAMECSTLKI